MTWARVVATGAGKLRFRLQIDGVLQEMVTHADMRGTVSDRIREVGLKREGIQDEWECAIERGTVSASGFTARIVDHERLWMPVFCRRPVRETFLTAEVSATATTFAVSDSTGFTGGMYVHIGSECVRVNSAPTPTSITVTRGRFGTDALRWRIDSTDGSVRPGWVRITDSPERLESRRARLYVYGDGDNPQGDGHHVWMGVVSTEPAMAGPNEWTFTIDSVMRKFEQPLGADLGASMRPRGIRRISPLVGQIYSFATPPSLGGNSPEIVNYTLQPGFWETQEDFCDDLTTALMASATAMSTWTSPSIAAIPEGESGYHIRWTTNVAHRFINIAQYDDRDEIDGQIGNNAYWSLVWSEEARILTHIQTAGRTYRALTAEQQGIAEFPGARSVPRGVVIASGEVVGGSSDAPTRVYVGGDSALAATGQDVAIITIPGSDGAPARSFSAPISSADNTDRYIVLGAQETFRFTASLLPEIRQARYYARRTTVSGFLTALTTNFADYASAGIYPHITSQDVHPSTNGFLDLARSPVLIGRNYMSTQPVRLDALMAEEIKAAGLMMVPNDVSGYVIPRRVNMPSNLQSGLSSITDADINLREGWPEWEAARFGTLHSVQFQPSFDPVAKAHYKPTYVVQDERARSLNPLGQTLSVAMFSEWDSMFSSVGGERVQRLLSETELYELFEPTLSLMGQPYQVIRIACTLRAAQFLPGDPLLVTSAHVPDWTTGTLGVTDLPCLIVGRRREWDRGVVWLTLIAQGRGLVGYTPSHNVTVSGSGDTRTLLFNSLFGPVGMFPTADSSRFAIGTRVRTWERNTRTPNVNYGIVTNRTEASGVTTLTVEFDSAPTFGVGVMVGYAKSTDVSLTAAQKLYAYFADGNRILDLSGVDTSPRSYG